jgi:hypothetical protein
VGIGTNLPQIPKPCWSNGILIRILLAVVSLGLVACGDEATDTGADECQLVDLPVSGGANGPLVTDVAIELQEGDGVVVLATATDPQGSRDLRDVPQIIRVFQDARCERSPIVMQDDLAGSGQEESFGSAAPWGSELYNTIAPTEGWPVEVDFRDTDGNETVGRVLARVIHP